MIFSLRNLFRAPLLLWPFKREGGGKDGGGEVRKVSHRGWNKHPTYQHSLNERVMSDFMPTRPTRHVCAILPVYNQIMYNKLNVCSGFILREGNKVSSSSLRSSYG